MWLAASSTTHIHDGKEQPIANIYWLNYPEGDSECPAAFRTVVPSLILTFDFCVEDGLEKTHFPYMDQ